MSADNIAVVLVLIASFPATLFPLLYGITTPWWRSYAGRALMASATGLGLLIDISLLYQWLGDDYFLRDVVRLSVYAIVALGSWLTLAAYAQQKYRNRRP